MGAFEDYIRHERDEAARRAEVIQARRKAARETAEKLAGLLATQFGVERVYLFGSVVTGHFSLQSDIDLACTGLAPERFFTAWAELNTAGDFQVDLLSLESAPAALRSRVYSEGVILFDRGNREAG